MTNIYDFTMKTIDGGEQSLGDYRGKAVLVVNVASQCGLTPHYAGLQKLYEKYAPQGLVVLGFPCNQFGAQEPGTEADIKKFCDTNYGVTFPMFAKVDVNGQSASPLYRYLTSQDTKPDASGDIKWNFAKFLIGKDGHIIARLAPPTDPTTPEFVHLIERALGAG